MSEVERTGDGAESRGVATVGEGSAPRRRGLGLRWKVVLLVLGCLSLVLMWVGTEAEFRARKRAVAKLEEAGAVVQFAPPWGVAGEFLVRYCPWGEPFLPAGEALVMCGGRFTDDDLPLLRELGSALTMLGLDGSRVTDAGLLQLASLKRLRALSLSQLDITGAGLKVLREIQTLKELRFYEMRLSDSDLETLRELKQLRFLELWGVPVTDAAVSSLRELSGLRMLKLERTKMTCEGVGGLSNLSQLEALSLIEMRITEKGMESFQQFKALKSLELEDGALTDKEVLKLAELKGLTFLVIRSKKVTGAGIQELQKKMPKTQVIHAP